METCLEDGFLYNLNLDLHPATTTLPTMDKPLTSPLLIEQVGRPTKLTPSATFAHLQNFLVSLDPSPSKTQLERLGDALGVEVGAIEPSEGERREAERSAAIAAARAERRRKKEEEERAAAAAAAAGTDAALESALEAQAEAEDDDDEMGENDFEGDQTMDDRGDVEYGDAPDEDEDEPDNE
jgi:hypothetical protein